ncbi:hypothetical protein G4228_007174, partial [Cervus hanglu yarkandensis]
ETARRTHASGTYSFPDQTQHSDDTNIPGAQSPDGGQRRYNLTESTTPELTRKQKVMAFPPRKREAKATRFVPLVTVNPGSCRVCYEQTSHFFRPPALSTPQKAGQRSEELLLLTAASPRS